MKSLPYSPFNRTYSFLCYQNQVAHNRNKKSVKGLVDSNLKVKRNSISMSQSRAKSFQSKQSSALTSNSSYLNMSGSLKENPKIIHKNYFYNQKIRGEIENENRRMSKKISETKCRVESNKKKREDYKLKQIYKDIACKFDKEDNRSKHMVKFIDPLLSSSHAFDDIESSKYFCRYTSARKK